MASGPTDLRLLVAFEDEYRAYRGAISTAIQDLRPHVTVETSDTHALPRKLDRFDPQAVISSDPEGPVAAGRIAWVELPSSPEQTARTRLGDDRFELANPSLQEILEILDEVERRLAPNPPPD